MEYIKSYLWFTELFAICLSFSIAAIFSENPLDRKNSGKNMLKSFLILFVIFSVFLNVLTYVGYKNDKKENNYTKEILLKKHYCSNCTFITLTDNFFKECSFNGNVYIYQGFRKYSVVNKNKNFQYILLSDKKRSKIKDNRYFISSFNFNSLSKNVITINKTQKTLSIPHDVLKDNKNIDIISSIKIVYEKACNFTPPKN